MSQVNEWGGGMSFVLVASAPVESLAAGTASGGPGDTAAWTTGNKLAVGTSADTTSKVWFTVRVD
jgi:glucoamylase